MTDAAAIRRALEPSHDFDESRRVHVAKDRSAFAYSDGAAAEAYIASAVREAQDIACGSSELASRIRDWPSLYHLGVARQNLLRPLGGRFGQAVLEVGAGCGAITRLLGESGAAVLAVEGSLERATIAASRCRDLPNVVVACGNFEALSVDLRFDLVTLIGVLEYSRLFFTGHDPVQSMLARAAELMAPGGLLAVAIENQLGLKYLAGAREDHTGVPYFGVTDQYGEKTPVTFGERELRERLASAGCGEMQFLYPFPDYKLPAIVVTERGFADPRFNVADLVTTAPPRRLPHEVRLAFSETLAREVFIRNGLGTATANSFLALAGSSDGARARFTDPDVLAYVYTTGRRRCYAKETRAWATGRDAVRVVRRRLYEGIEPPQDAPVRQRLVDEDYVVGETMFRRLERLVGRRGWSVDDLAAWLRPLVALLSQRSQGDGGDDPVVPAAFFECTPFNVMRRTDGALVPFDLEWEPAGTPPSLSHVVFRGLWNSLARLEHVAAPTADTPTDIASIASKVMERLGIAVSFDRMLAWLREEYAISNEVGTGGAEPPAAIPHFELAGVGEHRSAGLPRVASGLGGAEAPGRGFHVQLFVATPERGYSEETSVKVFAGGEGDRIIASLPLASAPNGYIGLRLDPLDLPGLFRLERLSLVNDRGELLWESDRCRPPDVANVNQLVDLSQQVGAASGTVWFASGADPHFDLSVPAELLARLTSGGVLHIEMGRLDAVELSALVRLAQIGAG